jgi:Glycosyltransferase family 87
VVSVPALRGDVGRSGDSVWGWSYWGLFALYLVLGMALRVSGWIHGDGVWFVEAAKKVLDGSFDVYSYRTGPELFPPAGAAYAYTPLTAIIMAPFVGFAQLVGWGEEGAQWLISVPLLVIDIFAAMQLRALARSWRPTIDERYLFAGIAVTLFLTSLLGDSAYYSHNEGLQLLFLLLALRLTPRSIVLGGLCAGMALAAKHTMLLDLLPIGFVLLSGAGRPGMSSRQNVGGSSMLSPVVSAIVWAAAAGAVFLAFMIIPIVRYPDSVYYAFVTQIARLQLFGTGLPVWVYRGLEFLFGPAQVKSYEVYYLGYANWALFGVVTLICAYTIWWLAKSGRPLGLIDSRLLGLVAFAAVAQVVLGKWVSGHYYQLPLALVFLWDVVRRTPESPHGKLSGGYPTLRSDALPWIGLGAPVVFRSITQFGVWWVKDLAILALFIGLMVLLLASVFKDPAGIRANANAPSVSL